MRIIIYFCLMSLIYSANAGESSNPLAGYMPSGGSFPFGFDTFKKCYEYASQQFQSSGYFPGSGQRGESSKPDESGSLMSNVQFQEIFKKCMEEEKPSSYKKRSADVKGESSGNPLAGYMPSGGSLPFGFDTFKKCWEYAQEQFQSSGYIPGSGQRGDSDSGSSSIQFQEIFKKCMEEKKPSSYKKRSAEVKGESGGNPLAGYMPSGGSLPFGFDTFKKCWEYAQEQFQSSGYIPGYGQKGDSKPDESGSSNIQFQEIFKKCMEEKKPSSYKKRSPDSEKSKAMRHVSLFY